MKQLDTPGKPASVPALGCAVRGYSRVYKQGTLTCLNLHILEYYLIYITHKNNGWGYTNLLNYGYIAANKRNCTPFFMASELAFHLHQLEAQVRPATWQQPATSGFASYGGPMIYDC